MIQKTNKSEIVKMRADPITVSRLDQLAQKMSGGNRSEALRKLIDLASAGQQSQQGRGSDKPV